MKTLILTISLLTIPLTTLAADLIRPIQGLYVCVDGSDQSVCDQNLKPYFTGDTLTAIKVEYVGYCGSMGPYTYFCQNNVCEDAGLRFDFRDESNYRWENKQYKIFCEMAKN